MQCGYSYSMSLLFIVHAIASSLHCIVASSRLPASTCTSFLITEHARSVQNLIMAERSNVGEESRVRTTCGLEAITKKRKMLLVTVI